MRYIANQCSLKLRREEKLRETTMSTVMSDHLLKGKKGKGYYYG